MHTSTPFEEQRPIPPQTPVELRAWRFMRDYQEKNHMPATLIEIAEALPDVADWKTSSRNIVMRLVEMGWVEEVLPPKQHRRFRAVVPPVKSAEDLEIELMRTTAGFGGTILP